MKMTTLFNYAEHISTILSNLRRGSDGISNNRVALYR